MYFIDTHTHLYASEFDLDRDVVIENGLANNVKQFLLPNIDVSSLEILTKLTQKYPENCFAMAGLHPCSVNENWVSDLAQIKLFFNDKRIIAIGEIGIDLYWDKTFLKEQVQAFETQIEWAKQLKLPIVIHARNSFDEIFEVIERHNDEFLTGVFHCFSGSIEQAQQIIRFQGFKLGIGGVVTYKNSGLDSVLKEVPMKELILETDSPYLAPAPFRGKRNESAYLTYIAEKISSIYEVPIQEVATVTSQSARELFNLTRYE